MGAIQSWLTKEKAEERRKLLGDALDMIGISGGGLKYLRRWPIGEFIIKNVLNFALLQNMD